PEPPAPVDTNEPAAAASLLHEDVHGDLTGVHGIARRLEDVEGAPRQHHADDGLAFARAGDGARRALRVGAAADERGVAYAAGRLARHSASRGGGSDQAAPVEGDRTHGAPDHAFELAPLRVRDQLLGAAEGNAELARPGHGALAYEEGMAVGLEGAPGQRDRAAYVGDAGDRPVSQGVAFHDRRVHFHRAVRGEHGATPRVETWIVLHGCDRGLHGVDGAATLPKPRPSCRHRIADPLSQLLASELW